MTDGSTVALDDGLRLSYAAQGDAAGPALVLLPGPTDSWRSYQPVLEQLPPAVRAIAVSQRGHGDSDKPPSGYLVEDFAADVVKFLDALGIERAVLAGHSASCLVARRVAIDSPTRVAGLVLEASPTRVSHVTGFEAFVETVIGDLTDPIDRDFARSFVTDTSSDALDEDVIDRLVVELLKVPPHVWRETFAGLLHYDDLTEVGNIDTPTLLVWGDADPLVTRDMQDKLTTLLTASELLVYPGAGHAPRWEEPSRFAADLVAFTRRNAPRDLPDRPRRPPARA